MKKKPRGDKSNSGEIESRRLKIMHYFGTQMSIGEIHKKLLADGIKISRATMHRDLIEVKKTLKERAQELADGWIQQDIAEHRTVMREAWQNYFREFKDDRKLGREYLSSIGRMQKDFAERMVTYGVAPKVAEKMEVTAIEVKLVDDPYAKRRNTKKTPDKPAVHTS